MLGTIKHCEVPSVFESTNIGTTVATIPFEHCAKCSIFARTEGVMLVRGKMYMYNSATSITVSSHYTRRPYGSCLGMPRQGPKLLNICQYLYER